MTAPVDAPDRVDSEATAKDAESENATPPDDGVTAAVNAKQRKAAEEEGDTYPGTDKFPIATREQARNAVQLYGNSDIPAEKVKAWLKRRLKAKGWEDLIPDSWKDAVTAASDTKYPPLTWFTDPGFAQETPITIDDDGHVYGHIASWHRPHIGFNGQKVYAPHSQRDYADFLYGGVKADDNGVPRIAAVGHLTMDTGHADLGLNADATRHHYDHTGYAWADVAVGEDEHGIWCNGILKPGITQERKAYALAHPPSGDWRPIDGGLELVAALCVNTPGFGIPRARVASGEVVALVAAGAVPPADAPAVPDPASFAAAVVAALDAREERAALLADLGRDPEETEEAQILRLTLLEDDDDEDVAELVAAMVAAADLPSTMPPQLQRSYLTGKVAKRIKWRTPGDMTRCMAQARAHGMGRMAAGACARLHRIATGVWPGDRRNVGRAG